MSTALPNIEGVEATFWHLDDADWTPVQKQRNADGTVAAVREKWPIMRPDFLSAYVHYDPGMVVRRHGHRSNHIVFVLDGGAWIGDDWCTTGTHIHVPLGATFGPIVAGPDGVTCWELSFGEFGGWGDEQALYDREIEARASRLCPTRPSTSETGLRILAVTSVPSAARRRVPGLLETITMMDQLKWTEVKRQRNADGSVSAIREKWPIAQPNFMTAYVEYDARMITRRHGHFGHHLVWVIAAARGSAIVGARLAPTSSSRSVRPSAQSSRATRGPASSRSPTATSAAGATNPRRSTKLSPHAVTPLPDPPIELGAWFGDKRGYWAPNGQPATS